MIDPNRFSECRSAEGKKEEAQSAEASLKEKGLMDVLLKDISKLPEQDRKSISDWERKRSEARELAFYCKQKLEGPGFLRSVFMVLAGIAGASALLAFILRR